MGPRPRALESRTGRAARLPRASLRAQRARPRPQVLAHPWVKSETDLLDQGSYNAIATMDEEAPSWRGALYVSGDDLEDVDFEEEDVYRSLGAVYRSLDMAADQTLPQPALARQRPFAPFLIDDVDEGAN